MRLPGANQAIVDIAKLRDYSLNSLHPEGKHKARVFQSALGFGAEDAARLRELILNAILANDAAERTPTPYGQRFVVDFDATGPLGSARIRTAWMVRNQEESPRLTSCYVI
jgi:hypothetical protein